MQKTSRYVYQRKTINISGERDIQREKERERDEEIDN